MKYLAALLFIAASFSSAYAVDRSAEYLTVADKISKDLPKNDVLLASRYGAYKIVLVPGYAADSIQTLMRILSPLSGFGLGNFTGYFDDQVALFQSLKLEHEVADINTKGTVDENGDALANLIKNSDKKLVFVAHSKGGLDVLDALIKLRGTPDFKKVVAILGVQSPFPGNPLVDRLRGMYSEEVFDSVVRSMGGDPESIKSLSEQERTVYNQQHAAAIKDVIANVKILTVSSYKSDVPNRVDTALEGLRNLMLRFGWTNDGVVPTKSEVLLDTDNLILKEVDHLMTFMSYPKADPFDRDLFTRTVLTMLW